MSEAESDRRAFAYCHARLPRSGLGNKLLVWARAWAFAQQNELPLVVSGWTHFQLAPLLRGRFSRLYLNYMRPVKEVSALRQWRMQGRAEMVVEPPLERIAAPAAPTIYRFGGVPHWRDYFGGIKDQHAGVNRALRAMIEPRRLEQARAARVPAVSLQVRLSDFYAQKPGEDFDQVGGRTPMDFFVRMVHGIRELRGIQIPVTVFSDGTPAELAPLLSIPGVVLAPRKPAIVDLLIMSAGQVLVPSVGSTFGYWAGFLGEAAMVMRERHIYESVRPAHVNARCFEGAAIGPPQAWPELLKQRIAGIPASGWM